jgi:hypothetical protein
MNNIKRKNNRRKERQIPIDEFFTVKVHSAQIRIDCSLDAYIATDVNFLNTLCNCSIDNNGSDHCCLLHNGDFDELHIRAD